METTPAHELKTTQKFTKRDKATAKFYKRKSRSISRAARDATLSIKCQTTPTICKIDLQSFKQTFFNDTALPEYSRLQPHSKLLVCQYLLHTQHNNSLSVPFVFRLPAQLHGNDRESLNRKIRNALESSLERNCLFWMTYEYDNRHSKTITHINGEILLLHSEELEKCRQAFRKLFKSHTNVQDDTNAINYCIRFPISKRDKVIQTDGKFYAVFNWVGYATKQEETRDREIFKNMLLQKQPERRHNCHYITNELNKQASELYKTQILKKLLTIQALKYEKWGTF